MTPTWKIILKDGKEIELDSVMNNAYIALHKQVETGTPDWILLKRSAMNSWKSSFCLNWMEKTKGNM